MEPMTNEVHAALLLAQQGLSVIREIQTTPTGGVVQKTLSFVLLDTSKPNEYIFQGSKCGVSGRTDGGTRNQPLTSPAIQKMIRRVKVIMAAKFWSDGYLEQLFFVSSCPTLPLSRSRIDSPWQT